MLTKNVLMIIPFTIFVLNPSLAAAGDIILNPIGNNDQNQISEAIKTVSESGGGEVYLNSGVYDIANTVTIKSNVKLTGDYNAILRVSASSQWFTGQIGVISNPDEALHNVEICNFQIDGNIKNLPRAWDSTPTHDRDAEKLILIGGWSSDMGNDISVHDMILHDSFSDAIYIRFTNNVYLYNNIISDAQHEGFYISSCRAGLIYNNSIAGITSDCGRLDNSQGFKVYDNIFFSYNGDSFGAYKNGENGLQIGDQGTEVNHGFKPTAKPFTTKDIEVTNNVFANNGLKAILLDNVELGNQANVYIHDNKFLDANEIETNGFSIGNYSFENIPTVEQSKQVFDNIFDILKMNFSDTGRTEQKAEDIPFSVQQTEQGRIAGGVKILGFKDLINIDNVSYIPDNESILYKSAAVRAPSFDWWNMGVSNISQKVTTKIENRTAYAVLTVKMEYYTISVNPITGKTKKNYKISTAVYNDSCPAPEVLRRPAAAKAIIAFYNNSVNPHTLIYVPSQGLIKVNYEYFSNSTEHTLMIGERTAGQNRVQITNFSTCDYWRGSIPNQGEALFISGAVDPDKLNITCFTPYESFKITDFEYKEKSWKGESFSDFVLPFVLKIGIILFFLWRLLKIPFN